MRGAFFITYTRANCGSSILLYLIFLSYYRLVIFMTIICQNAICAGWDCLCFCVGFGGLITLTFAGNTYFMITVINIFTWCFSELNKPAMCNNIHIAILLLAMFCIAFMNTAQHRFHFP